MREHGATTRRDHTRSRVNVVGDSERAKSEGTPAAAAAAAAGRFVCVCARAIASCRVLALLAGRSPSVVVMVAMPGLVSSRAHLVCAICLRRPRARVYAQRRRRWRWRRWWTRGQLPLGRRLAPPETARISKHDDDVQRRRQRSIHTHAHIET